MAEELDIFDKVILLGKRFFKRVAFHLAAFIIACLVATSTLPDFTIPNTGLTSMQAGLIVINYLGLLLLFPQQRQKEALTGGLICAGAWLFVAPWQWAVVPGALSYLLINDVIGRFRLPKWWQGLLLAIVLIEAYNTLPFSAMSHPLIYGLIFCMVTLLMGLWLARQEAQIKQVDGIKQAADNALTEANESVRLEAQRKEKVIADHLQVMLQILQSSKQLPDELVGHVVRIVEQTKLILQCMRNDPRDFLPGDKFLTRYLIATQKIVANYLLVQSNQEHNERFTEVIEHSQALLEKLEVAFAELHAQLLDNDAQDMVVELKVLDKLLKIEGFDNKNTL